MIHKAKSNKYFIVLVALVNFLMSPLVIGVFSQFGSFIVAFNFTLVILAGAIAAERKVPRLLGIVFGIVTLISVWLEFLYGSVAVVKSLRLLFSFALFTVLSYILIRTIFETTNINAQILCGAVSGFLLLGILGGVIYEALDLYHPGAVGVPIGPGGYKFYYFSFINLTTVGFGDIVPISAQAQAITVLLSILGQFYMAIGVTIFIGKYLNTYNKE